MDDLSLPGLDKMEQVADFVHQVITPTPLLNWPLLSARLSTDLWLKHENHNPTGSFKVRGGLVYVKGLLEREPGTRGVVAATRGNFGQAVAFAAARHNLKAVVVVPEGNSPDKNRAMQSLGAELIVAGKDFDESVEQAVRIATDRHFHVMPSFHMDLAMGVGSYALELFRARPDLDRVYVPIGLGSGICGMIAAREALGAQAEIVGVVTEQANAYQLSLEAGKVVTTNTAQTLADGLAVRKPDASVLSLLKKYITRIVTVSEREILESMCQIFEDTHNVAEGAGAASVAAVRREQKLNEGQVVGAILTGSNVHKALFVQALFQALPTEGEV